MNYKCLGAYVNIILFNPLDLFSWEQYLNKYILHEGMKKTFLIEIAKKDQGNINIVFKDMLEKQFPIF